MTLLYGTVLSAVMWGTWAGSVVSTLLSDEAERMVGGMCRVIIGTVWALAGGVRGGLLVLPCRHCHVGHPDLDCCLQHNNDRRTRIQQEGTALSHIHVDEPVR